MVWKVYEIIFKAKTPVHIGAQRVGMIQRTRHYIPAMSLWGALTSRLTRVLFQAPQPQHYRAVGNFCNDCLLTSYFFPLVNADSGQALLIPRYIEEGRWVYGQNGMPREEFERIFLAGYVSTAIDPTFTAAREASLHEIQVLLPRVQHEDTISHVYFGGYLFSKDEACFSIENGASFHLTATTDSIKINGEKEVSIFSLLDFIQVGGERAYGYGRLALNSRQVTQRLWGTYAVDTNKERPGLKIAAQAPIPAHIYIPNNRRIEGAVEPLVSRQWYSQGAGEHLASLGVCFVPGSIFRADGGINMLDASIEPYGILKALV